MSRDPLARIALSLVGAILAVAIAVAALLKINRAGFSACTGTAAFGWTVPIVTVGVIGIVAWILLHESDDETDENVAGMSCRCSSCGEPVIDNWRLCPYCGMMVGTTPHRSVPEDAA